MRKFLFVLMTAVIAAAGFNSCTDDTIGTSIPDIKSAVMVDSDFVIQGISVRNSHLRSRSSIQLLGKVAADGFGTLTSDVVAQLMPTTAIDTVGVHGGTEWIDSCFITMRVAPGDFTGDSLAPMRLNIYKLNRQLPSPIYSDFSPQGYYSESDLLGTIAYSASPSSLVTAYNSYTSSTVQYYQYKVPVPVEVARELYSDYCVSPETFATPSAFAQYFPGIYISNSYGEGHVMNFYDIEFETYYRKWVQINETTDTIYPAYKQSYLAVTPEVLYNNNVTLAPATGIQQMVAAGDAIVMGPAGYEVQATFPAQDIIDHFNADSKDAIAVLNTVQMSIPVELVTNRYDVAPPEYLLMVKESYRDTFFEKDSLTNNKDAFYAVYNSATRSYFFSGMRDYILDIINNKNGVATEADTKFVIMPIDVTKYTNTTSSYYYYSSTSTEVVTKIAPAIAKLSLAKLNLNKAKITLIYSKQSVF